MLMHTIIEFLAGLGGLPNYIPVTGREAPFSNDKLRRAGSGRSIRLQSKRDSRPSGVRLADSGDEAVLVRSRGESRVGERDGEPPFVAWRKPAGRYVERGDWSLCQTKCCAARVTPARALKLAVREGDKAAAGCSQLNRHRNSVYGLEVEIHRDGRPACLAAAGERESECSQRSRPTSQPDSVFSGE